MEKRRNGALVVLIAAVLLMAAGGVLANPVLELPVQSLTAEEFGKIAPWYDTEAKPLDRMILQEIELRELDESWLFITLTYQDEEDGAVLEALLFGERSQLLIDHASLRGSIDLSLYKYAGFILEPAVFFPQTNVILGIIGSIPRSYGRQFLGRVIIR